MNYCSQRKTVVCRKVHAVRFDGFNISSFTMTLFLRFTVGHLLHTRLFMRLDFETLGQWHRANMLVVGTCGKVGGFKKKIGLQ